MTTNLPSFEEARWRGAHHRPELPASGTFDLMDADRLRTARLPQLSAPLPVNPATYSALLDRSPPQHNPSRGQNDGQPKQSRPESAQSSSRRTPASILPSWPAAGQYNSDACLQPRERRLGFGDSNVDTVDHAHVKQAPSRLFNPINAPLHQSSTGAWRGLESDHRSAALAPHGSQIPLTVDIPKLQGK